MLKESTTRLLEMSLGPQPDNRCRNGSVMPLPTFAVLVARRLRAPFMRSVRESCAFVQESIHRASMCPKKQIKRKGSAWKNKDQQVQQKAVYLKTAAETRLAARTSAAEAKAVAKAAGVQTKAAMQAVSLDTKAKVAQAREAEAAAMSAKEIEKESAVGDDAEKEKPTRTYAGELTAHLIKYVCYCKRRPARKEALLKWSKILAGKVPC